MRMKIKVVERNRFRLMDNVKMRKDIKYTISMYKISAQFECE